jgi:flagellar FliL protein
MNGVEIVEDDNDVPEAIEPNPIVSRRKKRRRVKLIGLAAGLVLAVSGGAYAFLSAGSEEAEAVTPTVSSNSKFVEAPPMLINVHDADGRAHFLKLRFVIVAADEDKADEVKDKMPLIVDSLQSFLRELRPDDLAGSAAVYRIKEEMMVRMRRGFGAGSIEDVLIQDLVEQ